MKTLILTPNKGKCLKRKNILTIFLFISVSVILFDYINLNDKSGTYLPISERIAVYGNNESNELYIMDYVYVHERCHHYWYKYLNKSQREEYTKIYKNATYFVREYSKKNVMEDFADSCKEFIFDGFLDNERWNFLLPHKKDLKLLWQ
ncbi:MAG: hypothetical protein AABY22_09395 [Nanoarchaeota archaeon]